MVWAANGTKDLVVGKYTGNGSDNRWIEVGVVPKLAIIRGNGALGGRWKTASYTGDNTMDFATGSGLTGIIKALGGLGGGGTGDSIEVGTSANSNTNGTVYYYAVFNTVTNYAWEGTYNGTGVTQSIVATTATPDMVWIGGNNAFERIFTTSLMGNMSAQWTATANTLNYITALLSNGFTVYGFNGAIDANAVAYYYYCEKAH